MSGPEVAELAADRTPPLTNYRVWSARDVPLPLRTSGAIQACNAHRAVLGGRCNEATDAPLVLCCNRPTVRCALGAVAGKATSATHAPSGSARSACAPPVRPVSDPPVGRSLQTGVARLHANSRRGLSAHQAPSVRHGILPKRPQSICVVHSGCQSIMSTHLWFLTPVS